MNAKNITEILDALAQRFGATGTHLWSILLRQQYIEGGLTLAALAVLAAVWGMLYKKRRAVYAVFDSYDSYEHEGACVGVIIALVVLGILSIMALCVSGQAIGQLVNPEYYALRTIMGGN